MKQKSIVFVFVVVIGLIGPSCRGVQIRESEKRIDSLESRVAALEAKVE